MMKHRYIFLQVILFFLSCRLLAQDLRVENVKFKDIGEKIIITYDLKGKTQKKLDVSIKLSANGGKSFKIIPKAVSGDVGKKIKPGANKRIVWNLFNDYPYGLLGDNFIFKVEAKYKKKKLHLWIYPVVVGTVVGTSFLFRHVKRSSIVVEIPAYY